MHNWADNWPYFSDVSDAAWYIARFLRRWGRVGVRDHKEKYGTVRVYLSFGWSQLHCITHPGYCFSQYPQWLWALDCSYLSRVIHLLNYVVVPYHKWLYNKAYQNAVKKWPHIREEILSCADALELIDNCDDIKCSWRPPQFNDKDVKRLGPQLIQVLTDNHKTIDKLNGYKHFVLSLKEANRLTEADLSYLKECVENDD